MTSLMEVASMVGYLAAQPNTWLHNVGFPYRGVSIARKIEDWHSAAPGQTLLSRASSFIIEVALEFRH